MCLGGAGPAGPVIRAVLPAAGSLWWPRALAFRFHILGDSLSAQILNSQFGTIKKKKKRQRKRGKAAVSVLGEFSSDLSEIISPGLRAAFRSSRFPVTRVEAAGLHRSGT